MPVVTVQMWTGRTPAQKRFCVNTPLATVPGAATTRSTSSRSQLLTRAAVAPSAMPGTGNNASGVGGV